MNKKFFMAALTAVALMLGFTACEEEEAGAAGDYKMDVYLRVNHVSSDEDESTLIAQAYCFALGISDVEDPYVTIQGKDSLDCVNTVTEKCAKAEAALDGQQWSDMTAISVCIDEEKNSTRLYSKTFGKAADNASLDIRQFGPSVSSRGGHTSTAMYVQAQSWFLQFDGWHDDYCWHYNEIDLNESADGKFIYTMFADDKPGDIVSFYDLQRLVKKDDHSEELNKYIADVLILVSDSYHGDFHEFTYNGATYKYAHGIYDDPVMWDLNMGAGGPYLHLFYSTDAVKFQRVIDIDECVIAATDTDFTHNNFTLNDVGRGPWDVSEFVKAVRYKNGKVVFERADGEFNQGAGGQFIHMRADYISFDHLKRLKFDENGNAIK